MLQRPVISRGGRRCETDGDHPLVPVGLVIGMVRRLEHENLAVPALEGRNHQPQFRLAKQSVSEAIG
jgi:hypothetical protein